MILLRDLACGETPVAALVHECLPGAMPMALGLSAASCGIGAGLHGFRRAQGFPFEKKALATTPLYSPECGRSNAGNLGKPRIDAALRESGKRSCARGRTPL